MDIVIIGAGGAGREACWAFFEDNEEKRKWNLLGFVDENPALQASEVCDLPVLGKLDWVERHRSKNFEVICAVGNPRARKHVVQRAKALGLKFCTIVHPNVRKSRWVEIGPGSIICAGTILTTHVQIGSHVTINVACTISHDTRIGPYSNINPGCHVTGTVQIGEGVDLGAGSTVIQNKKIGEWSVIGAGAVVTNDIPAHVTAVGVPCRVIKTHESDVCLLLA